MPGGFEQVVITADGVVPLSSLTPVQRLEYDEGWRAAQARFYRERGCTCLIEWNYDAGNTGRATLDPECPFHHYDPPEWAK